MKTLNKETLRKLIHASTQKVNCDLVLHQAKILDVFSGEVIDSSLAIKDGYIVGFGDSYRGDQEIDLEGAFIVPSLIDSHVHIESTLATPSEFAKAALPHGITTAIIDPHEIANVLGVDGINFMMEASKNIPLDFKIMLSSCVPATRYETSGATLHAKDLNPFYDNPDVLGLAEVMDLDAVKEPSEDMLDKLYDATINKKIIDGHGSSLSLLDNNTYRVAGISTDHECTTLEEAKDRLQKGFYIHIREGSVAKNFDDLIPLVNPFNSRRFTFCTDDIYINDLLNQGSIDSMVRRAIKSGVHPVDAIRMGSLNAAECYQLKSKGAVAPGFQADFIILSSSLEDFEIKTVYKAGQVVFDHDQVFFNHEVISKTKMDNTVMLPDINLDDFKIISNTGYLNIIQILENSLLSNHITKTIEKGSLFIPTYEDNLAKIFVIERHGHHGKMGKGIVKGFRMTGGAVATTISHDSHNLVALAMNDLDLKLAINRVKEIHGGIVLVKDGRILAELPLDIAGLMSSKSMVVITREIKELEAAASLIFHELSFNPFLTLSFLTLPVIPELKITDQGLYSTKYKGFIAIDEII